MLRTWKKEPVLWIELAGCHALNYDFIKARQAIGKALQFGQNRVGCFELAANTMASCEFPDQAIAILQKGRSLHPENTGMQSSLAELLERHHRLDEATELVNDVLKNDPQHAQASLIKATLEKRNKQPGQSLESIARLAKNHEVNEQTRHVLWKARHLKIRCLDELKQYADATDAIRETAEFTQQWYAEDVKLCQQSWSHRQQAMAAFNQDLNETQMRAWQQEAPRVEQQICFLSGHPRSGTTLAATILDSHPDTCQIDEKEVFYRNTFIPLLLGNPEASSDMERVARAAPADLTKHAKRYLSIAKRVTGRLGREQTIIEKHPLHIYSAPAAMRLFPGSSHLVMLRDPRSVALSCLMTGTKLTTFSVNWLDPITTATSYQCIMDGWMKTRDWDIPHVHPVKYEDLVTQQEATTRELAESAGLKWDDSLLDYQKTARNKAATSPTYEQVTRPIYRDSLAKWKHYENLLEPAMPELEQAAEKLGY